MAIQSYDISKSDYRVGGCYHCLVSIPVGSLIAWILIIISIIGWGTSTWLGLSKGKDLLQMIESKEALEAEEIALIAVSLATVLVTIIYLIIATFSSQKMSRYTFSTSVKNKFGYCLSITVVICTFISVLFWTIIIGVTMLPIAALSIINILVRHLNVDCIHLPSYGIGVAAANSTSTPAAGLTCGDELTQWIDDTWPTLIPLLISIAFAVAVEASMLGFMIAASSNARHLRERMEYINEPYTYSSENINGNTKSANKDSTNPGNNNQTDTQI